MKNKFSLIILLVLLIFMPFSLARAADTRAGSYVYIAKDQIISGDLFAAGQSITIDGTISGDLITAAQDITVNGSVGGDIIGLGENITINGTVGGNIRVAGVNLALNSAIARNVDVFGTNIVLGSNSHVGWDVYLMGINVALRGQIDGNVNGQAGQALISGQIGKGLNLKLFTRKNIQNLTIASGADITGDVAYTSNSLADISNQAQISGQIQHNIPLAPQTNWWLIWLEKIIFSIFSALAVGLVLIFLAKNITSKILTDISQSPLRRLWQGLILMLILPPIALILVITLIGLPLALLILAWWLAMIYIARILAAILIGQIIIKILNKKDGASLLLPLVVGVTVGWLIFSIPLIGWIFSLIAIWLGFGGILTYVTNQFKHL